MRRRMLAVLVAVEILVVLLVVILLVGGVLSPSEGRGGLMQVEPKVLNA